MIVLRTYYGLCLSLGLALFPRFFDWLGLTNFGNAVFIGWGQDILRNVFFFFNVLLHLIKNILIILCHWSSQVLSTRLFLYNFLSFPLILTNLCLLGQLFLILNLRLIIDILLNVILIAKLKRRLSTRRIEMPIG